MVKKLGVILLLVVVALGSSAQSQTVWDFVRELNQARVMQGTEALALNADLSRAAQRHSNDMAGADQLSHTGTDGSEFWDRVQAAGYPLNEGAENVLYRFDADGVGAYQQWRDSPPHRANMMSPAYQEVGLAYAQSSSGRFYFTLVLASRENYIPPTSTRTPTITARPSISASPEPIQTVIMPTQTFTPRSPATFTSIPSDTFRPDPAGSSVQVPRATWTPMPIMPTRRPTWTPQPSPTVTSGPPDEIALFYDD